MVVDSFACHGSQGLMILYEKLYELTGNFELLLQSKYWDSQINVNLNIKDFKENFKNEKHSILSGFPSLLFYNKNYKCKLWQELLLL